MPGVAILRIVATVVGSEWNQKGMRCGRFLPKAAAAPATVRGEFSPDATEGYLGKAGKGVDPQARRPAGDHGNSKCPRVEGERTLGMNTVSSSALGASVGSASRATQLALSALLGLFVIGFVGFSHMEVVHNAAHDVRHSLAFPCH